jgi:ABC-type dipeptide/oligopeptide/nickel transport system ATPase component
MSHTEKSENGRLLDIRNLKTYCYLDSGILRAVDGVSLSLGRKATLGLVGESGCGKSMTAMSVMRLIKFPPVKIVEGEILFNRRSGSAVDIVKLKSNGAEIRSIRGGEIAMIFQEPMTSLNPLFTVGNQIAESVMLHQKVDKAGNRAGPGNACQGADRRAKSKAQGFSSSAQRRHAAEGDDRAGAFL